MATLFRIVSRMAADDDLCGHSNGELLNHHHHLHFEYTTISNGNKYIWNNAAVVVVIVVGGGVDGIEMWVEFAIFATHLAVCRQGTSSLCNAATPPVQDHVVARFRF